jgi:hypothetical protein
MAVVRALKKEYEYVLKEDRKLEPKDQTVWVHKMADLDLQNRGSDSIEFIGDTSGDPEKLVTKVTANARITTDIIRGCLIRVENLKDENGDPVDWPKAHQPQLEFLSRLKPSWRSELATAFRNAGILSEEEVKN